MALAPETAALADRFFAAIEAGDIAAVRGLYADDAVIWHNFSGSGQSPDENVRVLAWMCARTVARRYEVTRREPVAGGFMQSHVLHLELADGQRLGMPACLLVTVADGRIARLEEYLDPAQSAPLVHAPKVGA